MEIVSIRHRGLLEFYTTGRSRGLRQDMVPRIQNVLDALYAAPDMSAVEGPPGWRVHQLRGDRAGQWSISVSGNWRLTFTIIDVSVVRYFETDGCLT